jgi:hypothetical protein
LEIVHRQAEGEGGGEFVGDESLEEGLVRAANAETGAAQPEGSHISGPDCGHSLQHQPAPATSNSEEEIDATLAD